MLTHSATNRSAPHSLALAAMLTHSAANRSAPHSLALAAMLTHSATNRSAPHSLALAAMLTHSDTPYPLVGHVSGNREFLAVPSDEALSLWRRFAIRLIAVCVLGVLVGAGWLVFKPPVDRQLTSYGRPVANAAQLLDQTERVMRAAVTDRHGSRGSDARCYYATDSAVPTVGGSDSDLPVAVGDRMLCGPVLFIDGDRSRPFLSFDLIATPTPAGTMRLAVNSPDGESNTPDPRPASQLIRPDGKLPPATERLTTPRPPAAVGDVLTTTSTLRSQLTTAPPTARMVGQLSGVRLVEYGYVASYGWGDRTRTAPAGYRLLAFATVPLAGESGSQQPDLSVRVDGVERGPLTSTSDYLVTAVPARARSVDLVLTDSGLKQSISLLTGAPNAGNPAVTARTHTSQTLAMTKPVRVRLTTSAGTGTLDGTLTLRAVSLSYWAADGSHCETTDRAWLHLAATVKLDGDKQAYGAESGLLTVTVPEAGTLAVRNAAGDPAQQVDDAVQVPAALTAGSLTYSGTVQTAKGTITVLTPVTVRFDIPAG